MPANPAPDGENCRAVLGPGSSAHNRSCRDSRPRISRSCRVCDRRGRRASHKDRPPTRSIRNAPVRRTAPPRRFPPPVRCPSDCWRKTSSPGRRAPEPQPSLRDGRGRPASAPSRAGSRHIPCRLHPRRGRRGPLGSRPRPENCQRCRPAIPALPFRRARLHRLDPRCVSPIAQQKGASSLLPAPLPEKGCYSRNAGYSAAARCGSINRDTHLLRRRRPSRYIASNSADGKE